VRKARRNPSCNYLNVGNPGAQIPKAMKHRQVGSLGTSQWGNVTLGKGCHTVTIVTYGERPSASGA